MRVSPFWLLGLAFVPMATLGQDMRFQQVTTANGLSDNAITKLLQDRDGFLWIGTESGLNRFDGHHVRTWHAQDGLGGEQVTDILQDRLGQIWVTTIEGGLSRFSAEGVFLKCYRHNSTDPDAIAEARLNCLYDWNDSILLIGAQRTPIIFLNKHSGRFSYWEGEGKIHPSAATRRPPVGADWCHYVTDIGNGKLLIGFLIGFRQWIVDKDTGTLLGSAFRMNPATDQTIVAAVRAGNQLCGVGWQYQMHVHDLSGIDHSWPLPDECSSLLAVDSLHLLVGTASSGLLLMDLHHGSYQTFAHRQGDPHSLSDDGVRAILKDRQGVIWVGTRNGLNYSTPRSWWSGSVALLPKDKEGLPDPVAYSINELADGKLAICTNQGIFLGLPEGPFLPQPLFSGKGRIRTTSICEYAGKYLVGAEEGIYLWKPGSLKVERLLSGDATSQKPSATRSSWASSTPSLFQVRSILLDTMYRQPMVVMGVLGYGVALLDLAKNAVKLLSDESTLPGSLGSNLVNKLVRDRNGDYWAATSQGLYKWQLNRENPSNSFSAFRATGAAGALPSNTIMDLLPDSKGVLWVAMRNGGLAAWDGGRIRTFPLPAAAGTTIHGLAMDHAGRLWCAARGCFAVLDTSTAQWDVVQLDSRQGLPAVPTSTLSLRDGRIAFIADGALQILNPALRVKDGTPPSPYMTNMVLGDSVVIHRLNRGALKLEAHSGPLRISVSALNLAPPATYRYTFELEGVDIEPRLADESGSLVYASLPAGKYRLLARTVTMEGTTSPPVVLAIIDKLAPFWQRAWFYAAIMLVTGAGAYALSRFKYRQKLHLLHVRNSIASDLHDEVGSSLSAITIGSQLAASLSGPESGQARDIMTRLGETSSESLRSIRDIVWAIDPQHDEGEALVARMQRITRELLGDKGVDVSFVVTGGVERLKLPMAARKEILLLFKEAVHNCSKYAAAGTVQVSLHRKGMRLRISIKDDGIGFDPSIHPDGHGLAGMARRAKALHTELVLKSAPGMGTLVGLELNLTGLRD